MYPIIIGLEERIFSAADFFRLTSAFIWSFDYPLLAILASVSHTFLFCRAITFQWWLRRCFTAIVLNWSPRPGSNRYGLSREIFLPLRFSPPTIGHRCKHLGRRLFVVWTVSYPYTLMSRCYHRFCFAMPKAQAPQSFSQASNHRLKCQIAMLQVLRSSYTVSTPSYYEPIDISRTASSTAI